MKRKRRLKWGERNDVTVWKEKLSDGSLVFDIAIGNVRLFPVDECEAMTLFTKLSATTHKISKED